jgi:predicted 2-oxoglutarate/Fe(II)-dependent dioxygenase YbiX
MLITVPDVLTASQIARARQVLSSAEWVDGRVTAGYQSAQAKDNLQIPEGHPAAMEIGDMILNALGPEFAFHLCCFADESFSAAVQQLWWRAVVWHTRR